MGRRPKSRFVGCMPRISVLKPAGVPARELEQVRLGLDEYEALRLADVEGLYFDAAGREMGLSRATFGRLIERARQKVADAVVNGKMLIIEGGEVVMPETRWFHCDNCEQDFELPLGTGRPEACPNCGSDAFYRADPQAEDAPDPETPSGPQQGQSTEQGFGRGMGQGSGRGSGRQDGGPGGQGMGQGNRRDQLGPGSGGRGGQGGGRGGQGGGRLRRRMRGGGRGA